MKFNTKTIHGGQKHEEATGSVMPPIFQTSTLLNRVQGFTKDTNIQERQIRQEQH